MDAKQAEALFEAYYDRVFRYVRYRVGNQHATEDITSDIFTRVIEKYDTYSPEKSAFEVWLFAIARNAVTDHHRRKWRYGFWIADSDEPTCPSPEENIIDAERHEALFKALGALREKERHLIALKYSSELKNTEIAGILGVSASQVGVMLHRSLRKLQKMMGGGFDEA